MIESEFEMVLGIGLDTKWAKVNTTQLSRTGLDRYFEPC